jgi:precorrin-6A/cobalt-precorrin-6A reductase
VRIGGFGGPAGLAQWLSDEAICAIVDATHPFAQRISASARLAAARVGAPLIRLQRPGWQPVDGDRWIWVDDLAGAAGALRQLGVRRVFLTTGRHGLAEFAGDQETWFLIRCVEAPDISLPRLHRVVLARGPYTLDAELELIDSNGIEAVVTKDSGGSQTEAKLIAARTRRLPVVVVRRPSGHAGPVVSSVAEAARWAREALQ